MSMPHPGNGDREERPRDAVSACPQALEAGERPGEPGLCARDPDRADELLEFVVGRQAYERLAGPFRALAHRTAGFHVLPAAGSTGRGGAAGAAGPHRDVAGGGAVRAWFRSWGSP